MLNIEDEAKRKGIHCDIYLKSISRRQQQSDSKNAAICGHLGRLKSFIVTHSFPMDILHMSLGEHLYTLLLCTKRQSVRTWWYECALPQAMYESSDRSQPHQHLAFFIFFFVVLAPPVPVEIYSIVI